MNLHKHIRTHDSVEVKWERKLSSRPYKCTYLNCFRRFSCTESLQAHEQKHFQCKVIRGGFEDSKCGSRSYSISEMSDSDCSSDASKGMSSMSYDSMVSDSDVDCDMARIGLDRSFTEPIIHFPVIPGLHQEQEQESLDYLLSCAEKYDDLAWYSNVNSAITSQMCNKRKPVDDGAMMYNVSAMSRGAGSMCNKRMRS